MMRILKSLFRKETKPVRNIPIPFESVLTEVIPPLEDGGRRFVVGDIHGCCKSFQELVRQFQLTKADQLFLLGDYIDRGPDSQGVIDQIIQFKNDGFQVFPLKGNHEQMLLDVLNDEPITKRWYAKENLLEPLFEEDGLKLKDKYLSFLNSLASFYVLDDFILVHAGINFTDEHPFLNEKSLLWIRNSIFSPGQVGGRKMIHGHTVYPFQEVKQKVKDQEDIIPLDGGCVYKKRDYLGNLLGIDMTNWKLFVQPNVE